MNGDLCMCNLFSNKPPPLCRSMSGGCCAWGFCPEFRGKLPEGQAWIYVPQCGSLTAGKYGRLFKNDILRDAPG